MRRKELSLPPPPTNDRPSDRWECGHADAPCALGPSAQGICPGDSPCYPRRTWHGRRKIATATASVILIVAVGLMSSNRYSAIIFKPGDLATPHAQILAGTLTTSRCAACHPQAGASPLQWFTSAGDGHQGVSQTDRCLDCHHATIAPETARLAHNLPYRIRADLRLASLRPSEQTWHDRLPRPAVDQEDLQCSACHREHQGAQSELLAISDSQCQTCHVDRFGSFAESHPEWSDWPYRRGREISFSHATHAAKHFPATARGLGVAQFQCVNCHRRTADNELTRSTSYEQACKSCHDQTLEIAAAEGVELITLPMLSAESADQIGGWPESATGFYDGKVSPIAELLMRADSEATAAIGKLPGRDLAQIDPQSGPARRAAESIARAHRRLLRQVADEGQQAIIDRLVTLDFVPSTLKPFVQSLSPQLVEEANRRWFSGQSEPEDQPASAHRWQREVRPIQFRQPTPPADAQRSPADDGDDLLGDQLLPAVDPLGDPSADPLGGDPLAVDPLAVAPLAIGRSDSEQSSQRFVADRMMPAGGWYRDDVRMAIRYRGGGHDDPILRSTIELIGQLSPDDPARRQLLVTPAIAACVDCHPGSVRTPGSWRSNPLIGRRSEFTKFTHSPHLNVAQLADCLHCHKVCSQPDGEAEGAVSEISAELDFLPLGREACAGCHTARAAGDGCIKCHRYHIDLRR